jgi:hypothetical protein
MDLLDSLSSSTSISGEWSSRNLQARSNCNTFVPSNHQNLFIWAGFENTVLPSITAFQSATLKVTFDFKKQPGNPRETTIHATFTNLTSSPFTDFIFQAAVPKVNLTSSPFTDFILVFLFFVWAIRCHYKLYPIFHIPFRNWGIHLTYKSFRGKNIWMFEKNKVDV